MSCFNIVVHPPPSPSGQRPIKGHKAQEEHFPLAQPFAGKRASQNPLLFPNRLIPGYFWIRWSRKATSHLNPMTCDGSCHRAPVQFCKSHCRSESARKAEPSAARSEGHSGEISEGSAVRETAPGKTQSSDVEEQARNAHAASEQSNYDIIK